MSTHAFPNSRPSSAVHSECVLWRGIKFVTNFHLTRLRKAVRPMRDHVSSDIREVVIRASRLGVSRTMTLKAITGVSKKTIQRIVAKPKHGDSHHQKRGHKKASTQGSGCGASRVPAKPLPPGATTINSTLLPVASIPIQHMAAQFGPFIPNTTMSQHWPPVTIHGPGPTPFWSSSTIHVPGLSPFPVQAATYMPGPSPFASATWYSPSTIVPGPYENICPPIRPHTNQQSTTIPSTARPPAPGKKRSFSGSLRRPQNPNRAVKAEDPLDYPKLSGWLERVDRDKLCGSRGQRFSQFSAQFELAGLTSLLHLEKMPLRDLIGMTGMGRAAAEGLLRFVRKDIGEFRANRSPRPKKGLIF